VSQDGCAKQRRSSPARRTVADEANIAKNTKQRSAEYNGERQHFNGTTGYEYGLTCLAGACMRLGVARARVCVLCVCVVCVLCVCACAARLLRGECLMSVRHVACAGVWACAGLRYSTEYLPRQH
jgi:hypothetical protein